ncbi:hypothetical protein [Amycolatopsis sp. cg9]|uniref:hypothetical protein n=1 Tax=Amycolatopsis sp. cg9 TaxID=3238801 RepID=UPI003525BC48
MAEGTKHTCNSDRPGMPLSYGRRAELGVCPRCDELHAGAAPRTLAWGGRAASAVVDDRSAEIRAHFAAGGPHSRGACGPVCTFGDW